MKRLFVTGLSAAALLLSAGDASAQAPKAYKLTVDESPNPMPYALPTTTVEISVEIEKETVRSGPYARYAQKYLGVMAPLSDKDVYVIKKAVITYADPDTRDMGNSENRSFDKGFFGQRFSHADSGSEFSKPSPDRMSEIEKSAEDMARDAANNIFKLRKSRFDLITGEIGENVFGGGLKAALDEITRMENELLSMFMGKQTRTTVIKEFSVMPEAGQSNYIVFRFSPEVGVLPDSDLSANPVVLAMQPDNKASSMVPAKSDKRLPGYYRIPDWTKCTLLNGTDEIASAYIPVYQFGATVPGQ